METKSKYYEKVKVGNFVASTELEEEGLLDCGCCEICGCTCGEGWPASTIEQPCEGFHEGEDDD